MSALPRLLFDFRDPPAYDAGDPTRLEFTRPSRVLRADAIADVRPVLQSVDEETQAGRWAAGLVTYEAAPAFDPAMRVRAPTRMPLVWFGIFDAPARAAHAAPRSAGPSIDWRPNVERDAYRAAIGEIRSAIERGETYQVNYTFRLQAPFRVGADDPSRVSADAIYDAMRAAQGPGQHALLEIGDFSIVSASPELFFRRLGREITARPMKGTAPRGRFQLEDERHAARLAASGKERAENLMIVDLVRNDLGKLAIPGSVRVPRLFDIERYRTVFQMTSTVTAQVSPDLPLVRLFDALFPCGSVTGAPKIRTMEWIARLERATREIYCGAIGFVAPGGDCAFSVPIRTAWIDHEREVIEYGVGGGVTWDSTAIGEYDEAIAKAAVLTESWPPFELLETLRAESGTCVRQDRHLDRMAESARYFGFPFDRGAAANALREAASGRQEPARVRLWLAADGRVRTQVSDEPIEVGTGPGAAEQGRSKNEADSPGLAEPLPVALARDHVRSDDRFLFHKTTRRALYEDARAQWPDRFDVLLQNERGAVTEFTRGNLVVELDDALFTPPRSAGLLPGTFRGQLLEEGKIRERSLSPANVLEASRVWLISSLREWVWVRLCA